MNINALHALALVGAINLAPAAFAANLSGLEGQHETTVTLKSGKKVTVIVGKMDGKMMAVVPIDELNEILSRAEGHSMSVE